MRHQLYSLGELLVDFLPISNETSSPDTGTFRQVAGGAPANVAASVCKLGIPSHFIGKIGEDIFGSFLLDTLKSFGVGTQYVTATAEGNTALAFVSLDKTGERTFTFYRKQCADSLLKEEDIPAEAFTKNDILHYGSISLINSPSKEATEYAVKSAKEKGSLISYDPNIRMLLWPDPDTIKKTVPKYFEHANIIKVSDEEVIFLYGELSDDAVRSMFSKETKLILVTLGKEGVLAYTPSSKLHVKGYNVKVADTTGAGDAFMSGVLYQLLSRDITLDNIDAKLAEGSLLEEILTFANANAALTTTKKGAFTALPSLEEVKVLLSQTRE